MNFVSHQPNCLSRANEEVFHLAKINKDCQVCHKLILEANKIRKLPCNHLLHEHCFKQYHHFRRRCLICFKTYSVPQANNLHAELVLISDELIIGRFLQHDLFPISCLLGERMLMSLSLIDKRFYYVGLMVSLIFIDVMLVIPALILTKKIICNPQPKMMGSLEVYKIEVISDGSKKNRLFN